MMMNHLHQPAAEGKKMMGLCPTQRSLALSSYFFTHTVSLSLYLDTCSSSRPLFAPFFLFALFLVLSWPAAHAAGGIFQPWTLRITCARGFCGCKSVG